MWCLPQRWVGWVTQVTNLGDLVASTGSGTINWQSRKGGCNVHLVWDKNLSNKFICLVLDQTLLLPLLEMSYGGAGHKYNNSDLPTRILHREEKTNPNEAFFSPKVATFLLLVWLHCLSPQASPQLFPLITLHCIIEYEWHQTKMQKWAFLLVDQHIRL